VRYQFNMEGTLAKIVRFYETGEPEVLRVENGDPGQPGPGEVLLKVEAIGLNRGEAAFRGGHYLVKPSLPSVLGAECSARIIALGDGVEGWSVGDAVFTLPTFPAGAYGIYASEAIVPASCMVRRPEWLDPAQSAATWVAFLTAWGGMVETGKLAKGQYVIIPAASSSVGLAAVQVARDLGAIPIATTRRRDKADALTAVGAAYVVATEEDKLPEEVARITGSKGVELIFDPVAGPYVETLFECLADEGVLMIYGGIANQPATFPRQPAIRRNLTMRGYNILRLLSDRSRLEAAYSYLAERLRDGRFKMPIANIFNLDDIVEAHRCLEANLHVGKIVVVT
jgi:NADPH:quinone reductase-like Zn-dependent oxidoreductase